jgi:hypothetical protein
MTSEKIRNTLILLIVAMICTESYAQYKVPYGINYQAVARDNYGNELANRKISVKFSVISGDPLGSAVYQELHQNIITSAFGVFSLVIGQGTPTGGTIYNDLSQVQWEKASHYLKVEVKFENSFMDMGTMPFLSVPYALYAQKSLEPGPAGPKGDPGPKGEPGDPASDKQTLSFDQSTLNISGGNSVPLTSLLQNLTITKSPEGNYLGISRGNSVLLSTAEADGDPTNEIQDLTINADKLKITKNALATEWDLTRYLDNTDNQVLSWNEGTRELGISGSTGKINLSELKNDADPDPTNELQNLTFDQSSNSLSISNGNSVVLGNMVAFRAQKPSSETVPSFGSDYDFIAGVVTFNDGAGYDRSTGVFTAPSAGIYTFSVNYNATGAGDSRSLKIFLNGSLYEILNSGITSGAYLTRQVTMKLVAGDKVKVIINVGIGFETGVGFFSGFRVY